MADPNPTGSHRTDPTPLDYHHPIDAYAAVTAALLRGVAEPTHGFRLMTVANLALDGSPDARTVVVREFRPASRELVFHTDWRSPKIVQLQQNSRITLSLYEPNDRWQIRIPATAVIHHENDVSLPIWQQLPPHGRSTYAVPLAPGTSIPLNSDWKPNHTISENNERAYPNFAVIICEFGEMDVLELRSSGHRRVIFRWTDGELTLQRISP